MMVNNSNYTELIRYNMTGTDTNHMSNTLKKLPVSPEERKMSVETC